RQQRSGLPLQEAQGHRAQAQESLTTEPLLERLELSLQRIRQAIAEARQVLLHLRKLRLDGLRVHLEEELHVLRAQGGAIGVDLALSRHPADGRIHDLAPILRAAEDPLEDTDVVPESGPDEVALVVLAEP